MGAVQGNVKLNDQKKKTLPIREGADPAVRPSVGAFVHIRQYGAVGGYITGASRSAGGCSGLCWGK